MGGEMVPAGEPADVTDLAEERGGQHRPDPEQCDQGRVGLGDRGLDARPGLIAWSVRDTTTMGRERDHEHP